MDLLELQKNWNRFGQVDPLWAILTHPEKAGNRWDVAEFFSTGVHEIEDVLNRLVEFNVPRQRRRGLDFGCGVGRLTQALCPHFDRCRGVDIAPSMISLARQYNKFGDRCEYVLNESDGLPMCEDEGWDFIYSHLVLQHMRPVYSKAYISEFLRILAPGGALVFQLPECLDLACDGPSLPDYAFTASILPMNRLLTANHGARIEVKVKVRNLSSCIWPSFEANPNRPVQLGNHWLNDTGEVLVTDDARAPLERELKPLEEEVLSLTVTAPEEPGTYILELDMVQEHVAWFASRGSESGRIQVTIPRKPERSATPAQPESVMPASANPPAMEMYGVPRHEVLEIIGKQGGTVLNVISGCSAGPQWSSYFYFVTKSK